MKQVGIVLLQTCPGKLAHIPAFMWAAGIHQASNTHKPAAGATHVSTIVAVFVADLQVFCPEYGVHGRVVVGVVSSQTDRAHLLMTLQTTCSGRWLATYITVCGSSLAGLALRDHCLQGFLQLDHAEVICETIHAIARQPSVFATAGTTDCVIFLGDPHEAVSTERVSTVQHLGLV